MFFARSRRTAVLPVGVHVGAADLRLIQLTPHPLTIVASHRLPLAGSANPASIRPALGEGRFTTSEIVTALPTPRVHTRTFRVGAVPPAERQAAVQRQAREGAPFAENESVHAHATAVGEVRQGRDVRDEFLSVA